ncbi:2-phosphosulfolactate phosphatase [Actinoplanes sp. M2I2]|uniref:2-phosphosulfolactate phosphatase n=1 Tax=Actinoplanes sp. M2I2 TaxID=1734444 RepID=UPI0035B2564A
MENRWPGGRRRGTISCCVDRGYGRRPPAPPGGRRHRCHPGLHDSRGRLRARRDGDSLRSSVEAGRDLRRRSPDRLLVGESRGLKPADFDFGNSPAEMSAARLDGRRLILATSNGTRGLARCPDPAALLAVSGRSVGATARWIASHRVRARGPVEGPSLLPRRRPVRVRHGR